MPTLYVEPVKNDTECIFESCDDSQSEADLEVDEDEGIYFFPGGEATCPVADFSRSWFEIDEMNSKVFDLIGGEREGAIWRRPIKNFS